MSKTIWIMAGESSGESYGAHIATELWKKDSELTIRGMGGQEMATAGVDIMVDSTELGVVGLVEVLKHILPFLKIFKSLVQRAEKERPDAVILIDYPGFNLRFAKKLHALDIKVIYYVSPQVWAWGKRRIPEIVRVVDKMLVIFPFEPEVYAHTELDVEFVGHPLVEVLGELRTPQLTRDDKTILLLPGSRNSEVGKLLIPMLETAMKMTKDDKSLKFVLALPRQRTAEFAKSLMEKFLPETTGLNLQIEIGKTREWMQKASAGIAASGTVTVEAAILGLPLVSVYKVHWLTFHLLKFQVDLKKVPYFTMVNLIAKQEVYQEFLQGDVNPQTLSKALKKIMPNGERYDEVSQGMKKMITDLGGHTQIFATTAQKVIDTI